MRGGLLLYDADCGFCTRVAGLAPRMGLAVTVRAMQGVDLPGLGVDTERATRELPFVGADGAVVYGHRAVAATLATAGRWWTSVGRLVGSSVADRPMAAVYRWVARHRGSLPGSNAACALPEEFRSARASASSNRAPATAARGPQWRSQAGSREVDLGEHRVARSGAVGDQLRRELGEPDRLGRPCPVDGDTDQGIPALQRPRELE